MFLIKLWLLVSEEEGGVQGLDLAGQGILGVLSPSAPAIRAWPVDLPELTMLEILDLDEFLWPLLLVWASGLRVPAGGGTHYLLGSRLWGSWGCVEQAVVPLPGSTLHTLLHGCCPFETS